ncbi:MAG: hypothetical protein ABGZ08_03615, partial [Akkermansiaceae bacterium]
ASFQSRLRVNPVGKGRTLATKTFVSTVLRDPSSEEKNHRFKAERFPQRCMMNLIRVLNEIAHFFQNR